MRRRKTPWPECYGRKRRRHGLRIHGEVAVRVAKPFHRDLHDIAFVLDLRFCVRPIDEPRTPEHHRDAERVAHRRNKNYACGQNDMQDDRATQQARNLRPEWFAIYLEVLKETVCFPKIQHFLVIRSELIGRKPKDFGCEQASLLLQRRSLLK